MGICGQNIDLAVRCLMACTRDSHIFTIKWYGVFMLLSVWMRAALALCPAGARRGTAAVIASRDSRAAGRAVPHCCARPSELGDSGTTSRWQCSVQSGAAMHLLNTHTHTHTHTHTNFGVPIGHTTSNPLTKILIFNLTICICIITRTAGLRVRQTEGLGDGVSIPSPLCLLCPMSAYCTEWFMS
jgi:hypothetical protein